MKFEDLDIDEQRNEILKGIHNQLAQINKWLEVCIALYGKLSAEETEMLKIDAGYLDDSLLSSISGGSYGNVGYTREKGLYQSTTSGNEEISEPLGEYDRTVPIDEKTGFFIEMKGDESE